MKILLNIRDAPITGGRGTFREAETRLGVQKLCVSPFGRLRKKAIRLK